MMKWVCTVLVSVCCCGLSWGQTTLPVLADWPETVQDLADALVANDTDALSELMSDSVTLRPLNDEADDGEPLPLMRRSRNAEVLMARAYIQPPTALASDIADEVSGSSLVGEQVREFLWVGPESAKQANATAAQWVGELLGSGQGDLVGVILLWRAQPETPDLRMQDASSLMFVLVKAQQHDEQTCKVTSIVFGTPRELTHK